jgi:hypothetical protein
MLSQNKLLGLELFAGFSCRKAHNNFRKFVVHQWVQELMAYGSFSEKSSPKYCDGQAQGHVFGSGVYP